MLVPLLIVTLLVALTAFYVAAEFAAVSVRKSRIRQRAEDGDRTAGRLLRVLDDPHQLDRYIAASQIGITLTSLIAGAYAQAALSGPLATLAGSLGLSETAARTAASVTVLVTLTVFAMLAGELIPKSLALQFPTQVALRTARGMYWSLAAFAWFIRFLNGSGILLLRAMGVRHAGHGHVHSPEEIDLLIAESRDGGLLEPDEHRRLRRALQLGIRPVRQLMVPRHEIEGLDVDTPMDEVVRRVGESPYTRLPVFRGDIDHFVGLLHTRDLFVRRLDPAPLLALQSLLRPILAVPESMTAEALLARMRENRTHQALALDEFGGVSGLVTLDDVLTEVMGGVGDELKPNEPVPERLGDGRLRLPGFLRLDEAEAWTGLSLHGESDTLGGWIAEQLGRIPAEGERLRAFGAEFWVEAVEHHAVASVLVTLPEPGAEEEA